MSDQVEIPPLIVAARRYVGVPFRHHGRTVKSLDCVGYVRLSYADCGHASRDVRFYGREPYKGQLMEVIKAELGEPVGLGPDVELRIGDVVVLHYGNQPHHVAMVGWLPYGGLSLMHADGNVGRVVENRLDEVWRQRIVAVFRRPV